MHTPFLLSLSEHPSKSLSTVFHLTFVELHQSYVKCIFSQYKYSRSPLTAELSSDNKNLFFVSRELFSNFGTLPSELGSSDRIVDLPEIWLGKTRFSCSLNPKSLGLLVVFVFSRLCSIRLAGNETRLQRAFLVAKESFGPARLHSLSTSTKVLCDQCFAWTQLHDRCREDRIFRLRITMQKGCSVFNLPIIGFEIDKNVAVQIWIFDVCACSYFTSCLTQHTQSTALYRGTKGHFSLKEILCHREARLRWTFRLFRDRVCFSPVTTATWLLCWIIRGRNNRKKGTMHSEERIYHLLFVVHALYVLRKNRQWGEVGGSKTKDITTVNETNIRFSKFLQLRFGSSLKTRASVIS